MYAIGSPFVRSSIWRKWLPLLVRVADHTGTVIWEVV